MKYYLIVGEASGDLHASNLMKAIKQRDSEAQFRFFGGDLMSQVGGERVMHYRDLAYMGFIPVLLHLRTILTNMKRCKRDIMEWQPDVLILIDYPGFNLSVAKYVHQNSNIPVYYYISPKIWAWKEHRIKNIKSDVDELFSILPFEVQFYQKHNYQINYVGNPCVDAVDAFLKSDTESGDAFRTNNALDGRPIIALLAGSRKQEITANLPLMLEAVKKFPEYQAVIAGAPGIDKDFYSAYLTESVKIIYGKTYPLLKHAHAALVTSGTATLETSLFRVPQVVCYATPMAKLYSWLKGKFLKVKYISLINLIADREVVKELVAADMRQENVDAELAKILPADAPERLQMLSEYDRAIDILGPAGASHHAAEKMIELLNKK